MTAQTATQHSRALNQFVGWTAALLSLAFVIRTGVAWKTYHHIDPTSGVWAAAALDARDGTLYRPIESPLGYGGSRYAPLHIVLQATLMRAALGPVAAGYALDVLAILALVAGIYALLRELESPPLICAAMAAFALSAYCYCTTAGGMKGDLLAVAPSICGLAAVVASQRRRKTSLILLAAICFALALSAKLTSIFGIAASLIWLALQKKWKPALILAFLWLILIILAAGATQWASDDRALRIFQLCAAGGGGLRQLVQGPHRLVSDAIHADRFFTLFWLLAAALILLERNWKSLSTILFILATLGTVAIYGSPGTSANHLVDLQAASVIVIGTARRFPRCATIAATILALVATVNHLAMTVRIARENRHGDMIAALHDADRAQNSGPLLAENPILPIIDGQRPYMLDSFMFRTLWRRNPQIAERFWNDISSHYFRAVILAAPPTDPTRFTDEGNFGPGFMQLLERNYILTSVHGENWVYLPKPR